MNKIVYKFSLTGDKFMLELQLERDRIYYSAWGPFTKHRDRIHIFRETDNLKHSCRNELNKFFFFFHDAAYLAKGIISDKVLKDRAYNIARNRNYDGYQRALKSMPYKFYGKKTGSGISVNE